MDISLQDGRLTLTDETQGVLLREAEAVLALDDGREFRSGGRASEVEVALDVTDLAGGAVLTAIVTNLGSTPIGLCRLDVLDAPSGYRATPPAELAMSQTGWQSFSKATPPLPIAEFGHRYEGLVYGDTTLHLADAAALSPWAAVLQCGDADALLLGFLTARRLASFISVRDAADGSPARVTASCAPEGRVLKPGESLRSEPLVVLAGNDSQQLLARYADLSGQQMSARVPASPPTGWCSWYYYLADVTEEHVRAATRWLDADRERLPVQIIQLDDGYQAGIGDWLRLNDKFPSGLAALTAEIQKAGFTAGLWMAPFLVADTSPLFSEHPDWVVRQESGGPVLALTHWGSDQWVLDTTHPDALAWLRSVVRTQVREWGFGYLKLDFLYAGALEGVRHDRSATGIEAYRRGMQAIRDEAGESFLLGCGAPLLPSVGLVDGCRVSTDMGSEWLHAKDPVRGGPSLRNALRANLGRTWIANRWWVNDPDCVNVQVREPGFDPEQVEEKWTETFGFADGSDLTAAEVESWATLVALSAGAVMISEDLDELTPQQTDLIARLLPPAPVAAVPYGPMIDEMPSSLLLRHDGPAGERIVVAAFNWTEATQQLDVAAELERAGVGGGVEVVDLWRGRPAGKAVKLEPHGVALLAVRPVTSRPQVVATTLHLLGGVIEVVAESWQDDRLTVRLAVPGRREGELLIAVPEGLRPIEFEAEAGYVRVPVVVAGPTEVLVAFQHAS